MSTILCWKWRFWIGPFGVFDATVWTQSLNKVDVASCMYIFVNWNKAKSSDVNLNRKNIYKRGWRATPKRKRGRRRLKMATKWPLHSPQEPFSPHFLTWIGSSYYQKLKIKLSIQDIVILIWNATIFDSSQSWRLVQPSTNSTRRRRPKIEVLVHKAVEDGTCIMPWNMRHGEHHQLDGGPGESLQGYRGANPDENATAIVKLSASHDRVVCIFNCSA